MVVGNDFNLQWSIWQKCFGSWQNSLLKNNLSRKTCFKQFFGDLVKPEWISGIDIDKKERPKFNLVLVMKQKFMLQKNQMNLIH